MVLVVFQSPHSLVWLALQRTFDGVPMQAHSGGDLQVIGPRPGATPRFRMTDRFYRDGEVNFDRS